jgi:hypothetical protein
VIRSYMAAAENDLRELVLPDALDGGNPYLVSGGSYNLNDRLLEPQIDFLLMRRFRFVHHFAWAIPTDEALEAVGGHVVEVGAGGGYWAELLRARGATVHAYDPLPGRNHWVDRLWGSVRMGDATAAGEHPDATLLLCWPISGPPPSDALAAYLDAGGQRLVYVGEHEGGCCADEAFFRALERAMRQVDSCSLPQFPGIHDYLSVWERR